MAGVRPEARREGAVGPPSRRGRVTGSVRSGVVAYRDGFSEVGVVAGRVARFDGARGYGFIAPDNGEEDVFLHANDLLIPEAHLRSGLAVEFDINVGDRGPQASSVRLAEGPNCLFQWHGTRREPTLSTTSCARTSSPWT
ncbi:cold-shock protein [Streptomyces sp. NPDC102270]|uniref:cold-shock protein n=1 Tax=Streptomyces sp. NPDC102270 TaxID=3366150 RepID=UPI0037F12AF8